MTGVTLIALLGPLVVAGAWAGLRFGARNVKASVGLLFGILGVYFVWACIVMVGGPLLVQFDPPSDELTAPTIGSGVLGGFLGLVAGAPAAGAALVLLAIHYTLQRIRHRDDL